MPTLIKLNSCATNLDLVSIHGVDAERLDDFRSFRMLEGSYEAFRREQGAALVGRELAERRGWKVGDAVDINDVTFTIRGFFEDGGTTYESLAMTHLTFLQEAVGIGRDSHATQLYVKVDDPRNAESVAREIDRVFSTDVIQTDTKPESTFLSQGLAEFGEIVRFSRILGYVAVALILVLVGNTIYMATQDRIQEIAVLRTLGFTPARVLMLVLLESFFLSTMGGLLGAGATYALLSTGSYGIGIEGYQVAFVAEAGVVISGLIAASVLGILGGGVPAWSASRQDIVLGLRKV